VQSDVDPAEVGFDAGRLCRIDRHFARYVDDGRLPGWQLLVTRRGVVVHASSYGHRDVAAGLPMTTDTLFRIYSMTKPVTTVAAMMLYEEGAFDLLDPLSAYLPAFAEPRVYVAGPPERPVTRPAMEPIRLWHLFTHTAGLTYGSSRTHPVDAIYRAAGFELDPPPELDLAACAAEWAGFPLLFDPGSAWNYSVATDILGRVVEVLAGMSLADFFRNRIFRPLGMTDTCFSVPESERSRLARLYVPSPGTGLAVPDDEVGNRVLAERACFSGGAGLVSTLGDYNRFARMLLGRGAAHGVRLLGSRTLDYLSRNHLPGGVDIASLGGPFVADARYGGVGHGLGISVMVDPVAYRTIASVGEIAWGGAASTAFWVDPVEEITAIFLTQLMPSGTYPLRTQFRQLVYSALID
jgi:CubicO group peptidase (beta-lactamase class C family)